MQVLLIEHEGVEGLYPFSITHCSWELRCGAFTIVERWTKSVPDCVVTVASHRDLHVREYVERNQQTPSFVLEPTLIMTANVLMSPTVMQQVVDTCMHSTDPIAFFCSGHPVGAFLPKPPASPSEAAQYLDTIDVNTCRTIDVTGHIISRLWHALDHIGDAVSWDANLVDEDDFTGSSIHDTCVIDESGGQVIIMSGAQIGPHSVITGPSVIGRNTLVKAHASITESVIGPVCKVAGEIEHSIIQGYSNKQHDGFLGHSYLGHWVNLGAGTITSDLKNTYGHIRIQLPWGEEDTQRIMIGLLMGDHSKSAIGTKFSTGTVCGIFCNVVLSEFPDKLIRSYSWADDKATTAYEFKKAIEVARLVMGKRDAELSQTAEELLLLINQSDLR
ncbi:MAG: hypothetical protein HYX66_01980 [Ignavibacteria bacterium]|nr:hypothetical protein [Ignavibacteria bacterium]